MTMISYAQNGEDVVLNRVFAEVDRGFYVDIGAAHPIDDSVTKHFYLKGWRGINIEPQQGYFQLIQNDRPEDINLNIGISDKKGFLTFYMTPKRPGWSTFSPEAADKARAEGLSVNELKIDVDSLQSVINKHVMPNQTVQFLKIDVEGFEKKVIRSVNLNDWRPVVIIVEKTHDDSWKKLIESHRYISCLDDGVNLFFLRSEDSYLLLQLSVPANVTDNFDVYRYMKVIEDLSEERNKYKKKYHELLQKYQVLIEA